MKATLHDVAREAQCSVSTVSRVLNGREGHFDAATRDRVLATVSRLGYRANAGARATRNGHQGAVTLLMSSLGDARSALPEGLLRGMHDALEEHHLHLNVAFLPDERLTDPSYVPRILREWTSDGLLVNYNKLLPPGLERVIAESRIPAVWINHKRDTDACHPDDLAAGRAATRHLLSQGHRRIAYCSFSYKLESLHYSEVDRRQGYLDAMREAAAEPWVVDRYSHPVTGYAARTDVWSRLLASPERPTAVIAYGVTAAMSVVRAADRLGLGIPRDLSLATFAGATAYVGQDIDTWLVPEVEMGRQTVEMLLAKLAAPDAPLPSRALPFVFGAAALSDGSQAPALGTDRSPATPTSMQDRAPPHRPLAPGLAL
jgi:LacI family transcriptional regulator